MSLLIISCPEKEFQFNVEQYEELLISFNVYLKVSLKRYSFLEMGTTLTREQKQTAS